MWVAYRGGAYQGDIGLDSIIIKRGPCGGASQGEDLSHFVPSDLSVQLIP